MKILDKYYKDWSGNNHTIDSCQEIHDSAACIDFA